MATIVTRAGKGSPLTHDEVDDNFDNLNTDKVETSAIGTAAAANTGDFATAAQGTLADSALQDITGESIQNLSDVASMTPSDGQALVYGSGVWSAADMAGGIAYTRHTANVTMAANEGVIADTSGGAFTVTLPASPAVGDTVVITDGADWATINLTVGRNGSTIEGDAADMTMDIGGVAVQFTYDGTTWQIYTQLGAAGGNVVSEGDSPTFNAVTATSFAGDGSALTGLTVGQLPSQFAISASAAASSLGLDASGRLSLPNQPFFHASATFGSVTRFFNGNQQCNGNAFSVNQNRGNHFNVSTSRFTAPVQGVYLLNFAFSTDQTNLGDISFFSSGANVSNMVTVYRTGTAGWNNGAETALAVLQANDYVTIQLTAVGSVVGSCFASFGGILIG